MKRTILIVMLLTGICIGKIQAQKRSGSGRNDTALHGQGAERAEKPGEGDDAADYRTYMDERGSTGYGRPAKGVQQVSGFFPVHRLLRRTDYGFYHEISRLTDNMEDFTRQVSRSTTNRIGSSPFHGAHRIYRELMLGSVE